MKTPAADDGAEALNRFDFDDDQKKAFGSAVQRFQRVNDNSELIDYKRQFFQDLFNICTKSLGGSGDEELADGVHQAGRPSETDMKKFRYLKMHLQEERMTLQSLRMSLLPLPIHYLTESPTQLTWGFPKLPLETLFTRTRLCRQPSGDSLTSPETKRQTGENCRDPVGRWALIFLLGLTRSRCEPCIRSIVTRPPTTKLTRRNPAIKDLLILCWVSTESLGLLRR